MKKDIKKLNTRIIRKFKKHTGKRPLHMLTCYDYQTASLLNETELDLILVGDSLGNVILGYDTTICVSLEEMIIFTSAVKRGAPNKFVVADMPFGTYSTLEQGVSNACKLIQKTGAEAIKMEGAAPYQLDLVTRLVEVGVPVMGHIGLLPQSVNQQGGYYTHGKDLENAKILMNQALALQEAGAFAIVLECIEKELAKTISEELCIPTIGIGSGTNTDGQVLVINDLFKMGSNYPPSFCKPIADLYQLKKEMIEKYLKGECE